MGFVSLDAFAQMPKIKVPSSATTNLPKASQVSPETLLGRTTGDVMKVLDIRDTIGKTRIGMVPAIEKGVSFLIMDIPNGDMAAFKNNKLAGIIHSKKR